MKCEVGRGQALQQRDGLEHDLGLSREVGLAQPVADLARLGPRQPLHAQRPPAHVPEQPLEAGAIAGGHRGAGVDARKPVGLARFVARSRHLPRIAGADGPC